MSVVALAVPPLAAEWDEIAVHLRAAVGEDAYTNWCMSIRPEYFDGTMLALSVPTLFLRRHLEARYTAHLLAAARAVLGEVARIVFRVRQPHARPTLVVAPPPETQPEHRIEVHVDPTCHEVPPLEKRNPLRAPQIVADLDQPPGPYRVTIDDILRAVLRRFDITKIDLLARRRAIMTVRPRQIAMYLAKELTTRSLPEIGRRFGGMDHTTVLHAIRRIAELQISDAAIAEHVAALKRELQHPQPQRMQEWVTSSKPW